MRHWQSGDTLQEGKYTIEKILGSGGFGITYKATKHLRNGNKKFVAIKTLNPNMQIRQDFFKHQEDFLQEAWKLKAFSHPHIVKVNDIFLEEELRYLEMEYIEGDNLGEYLKNYCCQYQRKILEEEALTYIKQIGEALIYLHQRGILHRDVKPQNIMLRKNTKEAVLIDFGTAREFIQNETRTHTNFKTEGYAPIEQYEIKRKRGGYTDVHALAATLYFMLTMKMIIPADYRRDQGIPLKPPKTYNPEISDHTNDAIMKGMELYPENRPQTMAEWLELLLLKETNSILIPRNIPISSANPTPKIKPKSQRNKPTNPIPKKLTLTYSTNFTRRKFLEWGAWAGGAFITTFFIGNVLKNKFSDSSNIITPSIPEFSSETFNFETVEVNDRGEIINRENKSAQYIRENLGNGVTMDLVYIPSGRFLMGSPEYEKGRWEAEGPQHWVEIKSFLMGKYPVTQAQWVAVMGYNPSRHKGTNNPVENVSWDNCVEFCKKVSEIFQKRVSTTI